MSLHSEEMQLVQMFIQDEAAHATVRGDVTVVAVFVVAAVAAAVV